MRKFLALLLILVITPLIGGIYGLLHDQLTYTISPEYYTKFKFYQFRLMDAGTEAIFPNPRAQVCVVGFMASWWMGIPIGLILGAVGLMQPDWQRMLRVTMKAIAITVIIAFLTGLIGLAYGHFVLADKTPETFSGWYIPHNLVDFRSFIEVGSMHNFSYMGGVIGLIAGILYSLWQKSRFRARA